MRIAMILMAACAIGLGPPAGAESGPPKGRPMAVWPELTAPNYRTRKIEQLGYDPKLNRQDPSNVIRVGKTYYVWYTQRKAGVHPYASTVYYATSADGLRWQDRGEAIGKGPAGAWDSFGVITPYMAVVGGK